MPNLSNLNTIVPFPTLLFRPNCMANNNKICFHYDVNNVILKCRLCKYLMNAFILRADTLSNHAFFLSYVDCIVFFFVIMYNLKCLCTPNHCSNYINHNTLKSPYGIEVRFHNTLSNINRYTISTAFYGRTIKIPSCIRKPRAFNRGGGNIKCHKIDRSFCTKDKTKMGLKMLKIFCLTAKQSHYCRIAYINC
jgi:hypothetical protein